MLELFSSYIPLLYPLQFLDIIIVLYSPRHIDKVSNWEGVPIDTFMAISLYK